MKLLLNNKLLWLAMGCVLLVNGIVLGKVYLNRTQVVKQLELSERELRLPWNYGFTREDSSARVSLQWSTLNDESMSSEPTNDLDNWRWYNDRSLNLTPNHFSSFTFSGCDGKQRNERVHQGWVLLEFNGKSHADYVERATQHHALIHGLKPASTSELSDKELQDKRKSATEMLDAAKNSRSRLYVIDAAATTELLEAARAQRTATATATLAIVPATIRAGYNRCDEKPQRPTEVIIDGLAVESLYIPRELALNFPIDASAREKTKFTANINYGRLNEPWVGSLRLCGDCMNNVD